MFRSRILKGSPSGSPAKSCSMPTRTSGIPPSVQATEADTQSVLTVPASAVADRGGRTVVYMVNGGRAAEIPVATGKRLGSAVSILQGLAPGALVIDSISDRVQPGVKVTVR